MESRGFNPESERTLRPNAPEGALQYETPSGKVSVDWKEFSDPSSERKSPDEAVVYLPGAALDARSGSVGSLTKEFAKYGKSSALAISSRIDNPDVEASQFPQAEAIRQFIAERGLKELTIVGNSQGGNKAIDLTYLLQEKNPEIQIKGLVLIGSGGLYEQDSSQVLKRFFKDAAINTPPAVIKNLFKEGSKGIDFVKTSTRVGSDISMGIVKEAFRAPKEFPKRVKLEASDVARRNEHAEHIRAPIVMVQGTADPVSNYRELIPPGSEDQSKKSQEMRAAELKEKLFKQSENISILLAQKKGSHGVQYFRPETVAKTSLYMLERMKRDKKKE
ncbi:MAG TPA: alpha/beta hydrolase [Patescibacteria group bacterium]|nr:alpha/beta hydrolase [Patescibacteria group bacterium]